MVREQILNFEPLPGTETCMLTDSWFNGWPVISAVRSREKEGFYLVRYLKRWGIETGYRNGKQLLGQDEYQGRSTLGTIRHCCLGRVIYTYLELRRVNSLLTQRRDQALHTSGDVYRAVKREVVRALVEWLYDLFLARQNPQVACLLLGV